MGVKCPKCKTENTSDSEFCKKCATPLSSSEDISAIPTKTLKIPIKELTRGSTFARRYEVIEELGEGGMGKVYRVEDKKIKEEVALKLINPEIAGDKKTIERFSNELKFARKIAHRNVCKMYDLGEEGKTHYITMEYVPGENLMGMIRMMRQLSPAQAISIAQQICEGLAEAHRLGVVHRDLKPNNIMIDKDGKARIMDFGIARSLQAKGITAGGVMIGTPEYMSPEQVDGKEADQHSDIYSLGVVLYKMVTGKLPFSGDSSLSIALKHKTETPPDPKQYNAQISEDLSRVILRCMEKDKKNRYQSAEELFSELNRIEKKIPTKERVIPEKKPMISKEITVMFGIRKLFMPALIVVALIIAAVVIWQLLPRKEAVPFSTAKPSIAVLPFVDLSPLEDQTYFCDGLADELINRLSRIKSLRIPARTSAFSLKGKDLDIKEIGEKLNVEMVLEGSIRKAGDKLRITIQLVKVDSGYPLWSEKYDRNMEDIFTLQDEISMSIVDNLKLELLGKEKTKLVKQYTQNLEAYELYLKGRYFWNKRTGEGMKKSVRYFEQAIEEDPIYALAYAGLAYSYVTLGEWNILPAKEVFPKAKGAAKKALEIDNSLAEAHCPLGAVKCNFEWDWKGAEREYKLAIELNPNDASAHQWYSEYLVMMGRFKEAIREIKRAHELDPLSLIINAIEALHLYYAREFDRGIEQCRKVLEIDPNFRPAHIYIGYNYLGNDMYEEALEEFKKLNNHPYQAITYAKMDKITEAKKLLENFIEISNKEGVPGISLSIAEIYFALGEDDQGFKWLERAYERRERQMISIKIEPLFDSVRSDSRFKAMLRKMNFE